VLNIPAQRSKHLNAICRTNRVAFGLVMCLLLLILTGCKSTRLAGNRPFRFETDTFAYANEVEKTFACDENGRWSGHPVEPKATYARYCFVVARSSRQFFQHARFDPALPKVTDAEYRKLIRKVVHTSPRKDLPEAERIVIPGYANLREFSREQERLLKAECGSFWQSYFQLGHWRMVFPFSRRERERMAARFATAIRENRPPIVHVLTFPGLRINHAIVLYDVEETADEVRFAAYDPNSPNQSSRLTFHLKERFFEFPRTHYFRGGRVEAYEVYRSDFCY
jgi:hypothetical protein